MSPARNPTVDPRAALVIVDAQRAFGDAAYWGPRDNPSCEANIAALLMRWRETGRPIVFVRHDSTAPSSPCTRTTPPTRSRTSSPAHRMFWCAKRQLQLPRHSRSTRLAPGKRDQGAGCLQNHYQPLLRNHGSRRGQPRLPGLLPPRRDPHLRPYRPGRSAHPRSCPVQNQRGESPRRVRNRRDHIGTARAGIALLIVVSLFAHDAGLMT